VAKISNIALVTKLAGMVRRDPALAGTLVVFFRCRWGGKLFDETAQSRTFSRNA
jgi:hypothetical protein